MAKQTGSMHAETDDWAVRDLGLAGYDPVKPAAAPTLHHSVSIADPATALVGSADRCVPGIDRVPVLTWPNSVEADPVA